MLSGSFVCGWSDRRYQPSIDLTNTPQPLILFSVLSH